MVIRSEHILYAQTRTVFSFISIYRNKMDVEASSLSKYNDKHKYFLNVLDIFSRYHWSMRLKDTTSNSKTSALKYLFQNRKPITVQSDMGTKFLNSTAQQYLKSQRVNFHTNRNANTKGANNERFNRTPKTWMCKYFIKNNTFHYLYIINKF